MSRFCTGIRFLELYGVITLLCHTFTQNCPVLYTCTYILLFLIYLFFLLSVFLFCRCHSVALRKLLSRKQIPHMCKHTCNKAHSDSIILIIIICCNWRMDSETFSRFSVFVSFLLSFYFKKYTEVGIFLLACFPS